MSSKTLSKSASFPEVKVSIAVISVVNNQRLKPYCESFSFAPTNVVQQPLGSLLGFFEIRDRNEDSAYIVNFLTAVVKKEYYINPKRSPEESFDAALHKANIALSELAKNGSISWLGKLDAAVGAIINNHLLFSVAGNARVLLLRRHALNDLSEGLAASDEELHPLKTFTNVSSGSLRAGDKLIMTSDNIFRVLSLSEIQKNALRFPAEKFSQFLHTALVNELETAETIIADVLSPEEEKQKRKRERPREPEGKLANVFSEKAFQKPSVAAPLLAAVYKKKRKRDYIDKKTGHIYVQGEQEQGGRHGSLYLYFFLLKEKLNGFLYWLKSGIQKWSAALGKKLKSIRRPKVAVEKTAAAPTGGEAVAEAKVRFSLAKKYFSPAAEKIKTVFRKIPGLFPRLAKIKTIFASLKYEQRLVGIIVLAAIIILPLIFIRIKNKSVSLPAGETEPQKNQREILAGDKNINLGVQPETIILAEKVSTAEILDETLFLISPQKIIQREKSGEQKEFDVPQNYGKIILTASMKDLNLIFLLTDQSKMISWSPVSREFKENKIAFPENARIKTMATYLTYLYLADAGSNKIYRYPRAEGGFGAGASWLKEEVDLENISDIAIDENIYLADQTRIIKLFKGETGELNLEASATPISFNKVFTDIVTANIYVLDSANGRVVKFSKSGEIISQYYNEALEGARDLAVDEKNNTAFIITADGSAVSLAL